MIISPLSIILLVLLGISLILLIVLEQNFKNLERKHSFHKHHHLSRADHNPILSPLPDVEWEARGTFNPGAVQDSGGRTHLVYRAISTDGISRLGYALSDDGIHFDDRSPYPIFSMETPRRPDGTLRTREFSPVMYPSGGSWGGSEDPRLVNINGRIYLTFSAFDGWDFIRVAVTSIAEDDFLNKKWRWSRPLLISPPGTINKNWVLFPEKINGKFAILHSISPEVQIDLVDRLEDLSTGRHVIKSQFSGGKPRRQWDTWVRGVGPPPMKTNRGWLVLYHAIDKTEPNRYKLGALLLDLKNPRRVIARSPAPILTPDTWYENDGKPGIVYACGAVIDKSTLFVYYGGGDKYVCVAETPIKKLLDWLMTSGR
jgi:predicted GH43/DUF377 family glycosyl hydrolase